MVVKYAGRDCELSTSGFDPQGQAIQPGKVTEHILRSLSPALGQIDLTVWSAQHCVSSNLNRLDSLRHWLSNGDNWYCDSSHIEGASDTSSSPRMFAAKSISMLQLVELARRYAEQEAPVGTRYTITAANADTADPAVSWGSHLNVSVAPEFWDRLFINIQCPSLLNYVASVIAASIALFGSGLLLPLSDGQVVFSTSARAHHLSRIATVATTEAFNRGLLNMRREQHATAVDRLHLIGFDYTLLGAAPLCSLLQCALAAAEQGYCPVSLLEPVKACRGWSFGLNLQSGQNEHRARLVDGREVTLPEYMRELAQPLLSMVEANWIKPDVAPEAAIWLPQVIDLCGALERGDLRYCARQLDWAAKLLYLFDIANEPGAQWGDAEARLADHDFTDTNPDRGVLWQLWDDGLVDPGVDRALVRQCLEQALPTGRGWARAALISRFGESITDINWSYVELRRSADRWSPRVRIEMPQLDSLNRAEFGPLIDQAADLEELLRLLAQRADSSSVLTAVDPLASIQNYLNSQYEVEESDFPRRV